MTPDVSPVSTQLDTNRTNQTRSSGGKYESASLFLVPVSFISIYITVNSILDVVMRNINQLNKTMVIMQTNNDNHMASNDLKLTAINETSEKMKNTIEQLENWSEWESEKVTRNQKDISANTIDIHDIEQNITEILAESVRLSGLRIDLDSLKDQVNKMNYSDLEQQLIDLQNELNLVEQSSNQVDDKLDSEINNLRNDLIAMSQQLNTLVDNVNVIDESVATMSMSLHSIKAKVISLSNANPIIEDEISALESDLATLFCKYCRELISHNMKNSFYSFENSICLI